jgi:hypothetical protein
MGPPALLPIREEGVMLIFIAIKRSSRRPGLNPRPLGTVASTLTTTPPSRLAIPNYKVQLPNCLLEGDSHLLDNEIVSQSLTKKFSP